MTRRRNPPPAPSLDDLTNTFILSTPSQGLQRIPKALLPVDISRQRRAHRKSRGACRGCKGRRVKCDEQTPCSNCRRRRETCSLVSASGSIASPMSSPVLMPASLSTDTAVNLCHLKLFHHFQSCTRQTLLLTSNVWEVSLQLAFQYEFLMNAVLSVAARHLCVLRPDDTAYPAAAASHLCRALSGFRNELSCNFTATHFDAFVATSVLLQYGLWSDVDMLPATAGAKSSDPPTDSIFPFSSSLKQVFLKSVPLILDQPSVFMPHLRDDPTNALAAAARVSRDTLARYQAHFSYSRPLDSSVLNLPTTYSSSAGLVDPDTWSPPSNKAKDTLDSIKDGYEPAVVRLCLILSFLPEETPEWRRSRARFAPSFLPSSEDLAFRYRLLVGA